MGINLFAGMLVQIMWCYNLCLFGLLNNMQTIIKTSITGNYNIT